MRGLVFARVNFSLEANQGIREKCLGQLKTLQSHFPQTDFLHINNHGLFLNETMLHAWKRQQLSNLRNKAKLYTFELGKIIFTSIDLSAYDFFYFRYPLSSPTLVNLLQKLKTRKPAIRIIADFPTYPYEQEYKTLVKGLELKLDQYHRKKVFSYVDRIAHLGSEEMIWNTPTLPLGNGIEIDDFPVASTQTDWKKLRLIAIGNFNYWHGLDRLVQGIKNSDRKNEIELRVIGKGYEKTEELVAELELSNHISFHPPSIEQALDAHFDWANFGVGTLGMHRKGVEINQSLKHRTYAARGLNFVYAGKDPGFEIACPGIINIVEDESPVDMAILFENLSNHIGEIRSHCLNQLGWEKQMAGIIAYLKS